MQHGADRRIQSTWCEQQKFEEIVLQADAGLMMAMATGQVCLVWDFGSRNKRVRSVTSIRDMVRVLEALCIVLSVARSVCASTAQA